MKRKLAALLAADVVGYSRLVARDEEGTLARLIADRQLFDDLVARWGGRVFNTAGDAVLAEFASAVEAMRAALAIQTETARRNAPVAEGSRLRYRIGVTIGDVVEQGGDLLGDGVNVASRLEGLAEPGGICLSRGVHEQVSGKLDIAFRDMGLQRLKNMPVPVRAFAVSAASLAGDGPRIRRRRGALWASVLASLAAGAAVAAWHPWTAGRPAAGAPAGSAEAAPLAPQTFVFGPDAELPEARSAQPQPFAVDLVPFVDDAGRARIAQDLAPGRSSAVAITRGGYLGVSAGQDSADRAGADALRACFNAGGTNCRLFAQDGVVVWPDPLPPLPPRPWVDAAVPRTPFDVARVAGLNERARRIIGEAYPAFSGHKALALGPRGFYTFRGHLGSDEEAERLALESCGVAVGAPCRVVALGDDFVVPLRKP